jgi:hypothetical protein
MNESFNQQNFKVGEVARGYNASYKNYWYSTVE